MTSKIAVTAAKNTTSWKWEEKNEINVLPH